MDMCSASGTARQVPAATQKEHRCSILHHATPMMAACPALIGQMQVCGSRRRRTHGTRWRLPVILQSIEAPAGGPSYENLMHRAADGGYRLSDRRPAHRRRRPRWRPPHRRRHKREPDPRLPALHLSNDVSRRCRPIFVDVADRSLSSDKKILAELWASCSAHHAAPLAQCAVQKRTSHQQLHLRACY